MHVTLVAWLIAMPLTGWIVHNAEGHAMIVFGLELPRLVDTDKAFGKSLEAWHEWCGTSGYFLIGAHALAALYHHHVTRDNTLTRMLPWVRRPQPRPHSLPRRASEGTTAEEGARLQG